MADYNPDLIYKFTDNLYTQANKISSKYALAGAVFGMLVGAVMASSQWDDNGGLAVTMLFGVAAIGALVGFNIGKNKVFMIKLEAQKLLVNLKIEENTRTKG